MRKHQLSLAAITTAAVAAIVVLPPVAGSPVAGAGQARPGAAGTAAAAVTDHLVVETLASTTSTPADGGPTTIALAALHLPVAGQPLMATPLVTLPAPPVVPATAPESGALAEDFARLRQCESGDNYAIDTGNGFYGAYQFSAGTWHGMGYPGLPNEFSPAFQDAAAERLQAARGWEPWPACSRRLGL